MAHDPPGTLLRQLGQLVGGGPDGQAADAALLDRFLHQRDELAFAELVRRHGSLVLGVCRRVLGNAADADDAFQATFLVLLRQAGSIRRRTTLGSWLYTVACRVAMHARASAARRRAREMRVPSVSEETPMNDDSSLRAVLDEEIDHLPERYRAPLVLCYLEGKTNAEAAQLLGSSVRSVTGRLARARAVLERRLKRRQVALPAGALTVLAGRETVSAALSAATVRTAVEFLSGNLLAAPAAALAKGVIRTMIITRVKLGALALVAVLLFGAGVHACLVGSSAPEPVGAVAAEEQAADDQAAPMAAAAPAPEDKLPGDVLVLTLDAVGNLIPPGPGKSLNSPAEMEAYLRGYRDAKPAAAPLPMVVIRAAPQLEFGKVDAMLKLCAALGFTKVEVRAVDSATGKPGPEPYDAVVLGRLRKLAAENGATPFQLQVIEAAKSFVDCSRASYPQSFLAPKLDAAQLNAFTNQVAQIQMQIGLTQFKLEEALDELEKLQPDRANTAKDWQANFDYVCAQLAARLARLYEHNVLLGSMRRELPSLDRAKDKGWHLVAKKDGYTDRDAQKFARRAKAHLERLTADQAGTEWERIAKAELLTIDQGLEWAPTPAK